MSTYKMTPAERRARAQAIVQARQKWNNYAQYRKSLIAQQEMAQRERAIKEERESEKEANWFVRGLSTIGDIAANVLTGAVKGLEGIYDLGAGIVGAVGGIFDDDFQDDVQKHIAKDYTSEWIGDPLQDLTKYSWTNSWKYGQLVENIASGVGQMLPAVAATALTAGAGAPAAVSQLASLGTLGASATGNATESAYQDGASYYGGLGYGVASGAVELATEKLFGGVTKNIFGKGMLDDVGKSIADTGIKRVAKNALEEGLEEAAAEIANPALKAIYKGKTAFSDYKDIGYWKDVGKAGAIGSLTALAYSGTVGYGLAKRGKGYVGAEADINDSLYEIEGQKKKANNLFADDKLSDENAARITQNLQGNYQNIEKTLKKATPEKRANLIKKFSLESAFETDGTMKADFASTLDFTKQAEAITENGANGSENAVASLDRRYINPDLIGQDTKINETLSTVTEDLRKKYMQENNATYEQAVKAIKDVTPFKKEFTDKGKASYSKFKKGLNYLNGVSGHTVNMVVVDEHDRFNGNIVGDTIYIGADTFENDTWAGTLVHEYTHFAEGTKEYAKLVHYLRENQELSAKAIKDVFGKGYATVEGIEKLYDKFEKGEKLTESELQTLTVYESELGAHLTENLLGNESFIGRLVSKETKLAEKVLNKIADLKKMFERIGNAEARAEYKQIKKAEKLYLGAVEKAGYAYINRKIVAPRRREELDKTDKIQYAYRARKPQTVTKSEFEHHYWATANGILTKNELGSLNSAIGEMRNGAQYVKNADGLYMVPVGENGVLNKIVFTDGKYNSYSIDTVITINLNNETDLSIERSIIYASERKGIYTETNGLVEVHYAKDFKFSDFQRKLTQNSQNSNGKQNGAGNLNGDSGNGVKRSYALSVVDSDGKALSDYRVVAKVSFANKKLIDEWEAEVEANNERNYAKRSNTIVYESADEYASTRKEYKGDNATFVEQSSRNGRGSEVHQGEPGSDGKRNTQKSDGSSQGVKYSLKESDESEEIQYNRKYFKFLHKNFPTEKESGSEAHRLAIWWTRQPDVQTGDQTLISMNDRWYLVERFDDADNNYQVEEYITKAEFEKIYKEIKEYDRSGKIKSVSGGVDRIDSLNQQSYSLKTRKSSIDSNETQYGREDNQIQRVDKKQVERRKRTSNDGDGDSSSGSADRQGQPVSFSLKDSNGNSLTEEQAKFFADSKARDKNGNLLVVYHGTEGEFYTFDKTYRGAVTGAADAKLGFFFTTSKTVAHDYAVEAYDNKVYNLRHKIAGGDPLILNLLGAVEGYKELAATEDVKEYGRLIEKGERLEHDIYELYLNITNPLEVDFKGKPYKKGAMLRLVTKALTERRDGVIIRNMDDTLDFSGDISDVLVAFEPNQIKLVTNKTPTDLDDIRYSLKSNINEYTEKQYNDFGWARVNGVLSMRENADFRSKYGEIKSGKQKQVHRTANGEIIVAVNDMEYDKFGVNNVLVFAKGTYENYKITRVVRLQLDNETSIEQIRDIYYEIETSRTEYPYTALDLIENVFGQEIVAEYAVGDFSSYQEIKAERGRQDRRSESGRADEDYQREQDGSRNFGENQENVKFSLKDNDSNNGVRRRYALKGSDKVMTELPNEKVTMKDFICGKATKAQLATQVKGDMSETSESLKVLMTNAQAALERVLIENGIADATARTNYIRAGKYAAYNAIETQGGQYNLDGGTRVGDSLGKIMQPIYKANEKDGKTYADFELYLLHHHNIDRMAAGKPVFHDNNTPVAEQVTMEDSQAAIAELDKGYPQFRKIAEKIWKFSDNNLQLSVDSGMYSQEHADTLRKMYPHYIPTFREEYATRAAALMGKNNVWVNNAKKAAKGSSARILPIDDMLAAQTIQKTTSARINSLLVEMLERGDHDEFKVIATENAEIQIDDDTQVTTYEDKTKNTHQVTFYHNGKKVTAQVSRLVFKGIEAFRASSDMLDNVTLNAAAKVNSIFKKLVTSLNPFFSFFRNPIRDMQDALLYTRYSFRKYSKNYLRAWREIVHNGKYWQEAKAAGIISASVYDYQKGIKYKQNGIGVRIKRFFGKLESASNAIEMAPRLAEYICAREAGLSVQEALLQAQDVTTNFGRGGTFAKKLNSTIMPFLNPSIQGFSKMWRAYTGKDGAKAWVNLIIRSLILGIGMSALNDLLNDDDEEYEKLSDYVKEQNYLIALGGGDFLKIPKGRVIGVFGNAFLRGRRYANGETDAWEGYFDSVKSSVTPVDNFTRTIFSPITDVKTNTTWYGGAIESQKWNDTEPKNRYDESTSKIAIWLGKVFNYSPLKIDYLLEQYGGIVADLVLPATSTQAESGIISQNMLTNATLNSKCSTKFYSTLEDYTYKKTAGDLQAKGVVRYLTHVNSTVSEMYNQKRTIQADKSLSNSEKLTQTRVIQAAINTLQQESIGNVEYLYEELGKYNLSDDDIFEQAYLDCISVVMGEEYALQIYDKHVCEKATKLNKIGVDYATYYDCYFGLKAIEGEKDDNGETIRGSKKKAVIEYILSQNLSMVQKLVLIMAQGYTITDGDVRGITAQQAKLTVGKYITSTNLTKEEKVELAEMIGFPVKNGKIYFS